MGLLTPGFASRTRTATSIAAPASPGFTAPTDPNNIRSRMSPTAKAQETMLMDRASRNSDRYKGARTARVANTRAALQGMGGYSVNDDGTVVIDPNARPGERQREAVRAEQSAANSRGLGSSSFAARNIGMSLARLSVEAQGVVTQHAQAMNEIASAEAESYDSISSDLLSIWGNEATRIMSELPPELTAPDPDQMYADKVAHRDDVRSRAEATARAERRGAAGAVLWTGKGKPNMAKLRAANPGRKLTLKPKPGGGYQVVGA